MDGFLPQSTCTRLQPTHTCSILQACHTVFCKNLMVALCSKRLAKGVKAMNKRAKNNNKNMFVCCVVATVLHGLHFQTVGTVRSSTCIHSKVTWIDQEVNKVDQNHVPEKSNQPIAPKSRKNRRGVRFPSYLSLFVETFTPRTSFLHYCFENKQESWQIGYLVDNPYFDLDSMANLRKTQIGPCSSNKKNPGPSRARGQCAPDYWQFFGQSPIL